MKGQWNLILAFVFALIVAIFAVINVEAVEVDYLFGTAQWPLILIIIASVLMGGLIVGSVGLFRLFVLGRAIKSLEKENLRLRETLEKSENEQDSMKIDEKIEEVPTIEESEEKKSL
ncbi:lipopolysaccharide assembly protein LapA domain-containing protein [Bacillus timonensis]|nr:lipopolysaccharide assembly protein LapA domain-containing protein [Bacillus timonensis]